MIEIPEFLNKAAERCGFFRDAYDESKIPTTASNIAVLPFFGDSRTSFVLSSLIFKSYRERVKGSKYFILCSWPGHKILYPDANEYWSIKNSSLLNSVYVKANGWLNDDPSVLNYIRQLNQFFDGVIDIASLKQYYNLGLGDAYGDFEKIERRFPMVPSSGVLGSEFNKLLMSRPGYKIVIFPSLCVKSWRNNCLENIKVSDRFWIALTQRLLKEGYTPVIIQNYTTHDISANIDDRCILFFDYDISKILAIMRVTDCVLDVFNDTSKWAVLSRSPFISCIERNKYIKSKDYEIDDLTCMDELPKQYIFSFSTILESAEEFWNVSLFDGIVTKLNKFVPNIKRDKLPTGSAVTEVVSYEKVRVRKINRMGAKFIKVKQD